MTAARAASATAVASIRMIQPSWAVASAAPNRARSPPTGAILLEQNDEWAVQLPLYYGGKRRPLSDDPLVSLPAVAV